MRAIRDAARTRAVGHADETGWRETGWREAGHTGYVWLLVTPEGERDVAVHRSRAGRVAHDVLGEAFQGVRAWTGAVRTLWRRIRAAPRHPPPTLAQRERQARRLSLDPHALALAPTS